MFAMRKSDLKAFKCRAQDVCRTADGSTNDYLEEPRAVERFLEDVEPKYNASVRKLREGKPDTEAIYSIAGFIAYVASCSPAALRINVAPMESILQQTAALLDARGVFDKAPDSLGNKSLTELLADGTVKFDVDPKYPQAISTSNIIQNTSVFGNGRWEVLRNDTDSPYLTSDFPAAIEVAGPGVMRRVVPLAPDLAVRITPDITMRGKTDLSFPNFSASYRKAKRQDVVAVNRLIVRCAEDIVFYRDDDAWIPDFIKKNRQYCVDAVVSRIPHGNGSLQVAAQRIVLRS